MIVDLHPSYSPLNRSIFDRADRILVPVTPDLPAIRAVVKLREIADELGMRDRLSLVVNRANSGIKLEDLERAVGMATYAQIRSGGLLLVKASNEGRTLFELAPKEKITQDFAELADRLLGLEPVEVAEAAGQPVPPGGHRPSLARLGSAPPQAAHDLDDRRQVVDRRPPPRARAPRPACTHAHGPRRRKIARMPAAAAGRRRCRPGRPRRRWRRAVRPSRSAIVAKNAGSGFATPRLSLDAMRSRVTADLPEHRLACCG